MSSLCDVFLNAYIQGEVMNLRNDFNPCTFCSSTLKLKLIYFPEQSIYTDLKVH